MEDSKNPNMLRSEGAPSPKGAVVLAKQALPFGRKRVSMAENTATNQYSLSPKDKIAIISNRIEMDYGEKRRQLYQGAVTAYASLKKETFLCDDEKLEMIWAKTKQIIDNNRDDSAEPNPFLEMLASVTKEEDKQRRARMERLSDATGLEEYEIEELFFNYAPWLEDEEACQSILDSDETWETYENLVELVATGRESCISLHLYRSTKIAQANAWKRGSAKPFDETAEMLVKYEQQRRSEWKSWADLIRLETILSD